MKTFTLPGLLKVHPILHMASVSGVDGASAVLNNNGWISIAGEAEISIRVFEGHADADRVASVYMNVEQTLTLIKALQQSVKAARANAGRV